MGSLAWSCSVSSRQIRIWLQNPMQHGRMWEVGKYHMTKVITWPTWGVCAPSIFTLSLNGHQPLAAMENLLGIKLLIPKASPLVWFQPNSVAAILRLVFLSESVVLQFTTEASCCRRALSAFVSRWQHERQPYPLLSEFYASKKSISNTWNCSSLGQYPLE